MLKILKSNNLTKKLASIFDANYFPLIVFFVVLLAHVLALDIVGFIITVLLLCATILLCDDLRPAFPLILMLPYVVSIKNTPGYTTSEYYKQPFILITLVCLFALIVASLVIRFILRKEYKTLLNKNKLLISFLVLIPTYFLAGIFSKFYDFSNFFIAVIMVFLQVAIYVLFVSGIKKREDNLIYISKSAVLAMLLICLEIGLLYILKYEAGTPLNSDWKAKIVIGSLVSNSAGEFITMLIPFCIYLAYKQKHGYLYYIFAGLSLVAIYFTLSRASLLFAVPTFIISTLILCFKGAHKTLYRILSFAYLLAVAITILLIYLYGDIEGFFEFFRVTGFNPRNRFKIWNELFSNFKNFPIFGVGFSSTWQAHPEYPTIFQTLAHNTAVQIITSTGIVGTLFFAYHIITIAIMFIKKPNWNALTIAFTLLLFLGLSLLDQIYFFPNFTVIYTLLIIFAKKETEV